MRTKMLIVAALVLAVCLAGVVINQDAYAVGLAHSWGPSEEPDPALYFTVVNETMGAVFIQDINNPSSSNVVIYKHPDDSGIKAAFVASNGYMYYITQAGLWRHEDPGSYTPIWSNGEALLLDPETSAILQPSGPYNSYPASSPKAVLIASGTFQPFIIEDNGYLYFVETATVYKLPLGSWNTETAGTLTLNGYTLQALDVYNGEIYHLTSRASSGGTYTPGAYGYAIYRDNEVLKSASGTIPTSVGAAATRGVISVIDPDTVYVGQRVYSTTQSNVWVSVANIMNSTGGYTGTWPYEYVNGGNIVEISYLDKVMIKILSGNDQIESVTAQHMASSPILPAVEPSDLDLSASLTSAQSNYYNNTPVSVQTYISWPIYQTNTPDGYPEFEDYNFYLYMYDPTGKIIGSYKIEAWETKNSIVGYDLVKTYTFNKKIVFNPPATNWIEGVYTFRLVESSTTHGPRQIEQLTITVDPVSGTVTGGTTDGADADANDVFGSTAFKALMFITIPALGLGIVANLPGVLVGLVIGVFLAFAIGLIPLAYLILIIFAIISSFAAFARDMITGNKGG